MDVRRRGRASFGPFVLDLDTGELRKYDVRILLQTQPFEVLKALLERPGELVTREELKQRLWGNETYVDFDQGLNRAIKKIRAALNDSANIPKYVETLAKRGYRFTAEVSFDSEHTAVTEHPLEVTPDQIATSHSAQRIPKRWLKVFIGAAALGAVAALCFLLLPRGSLNASRGNLQQLTKNAPENSLVNAVISPDGNYLLYGDLVGIHLRLIKTQETRSFGRPPGVSAQDAWFPTSWFPDQSRFVAVSTSPTPAGFKVKSWIVSALGGEITPLRDDAFARSVSPDGSLIGFTSGGPSLDQEIWLTGPHGEASRRAATLNGLGGFGDVQWAPDSQHFAALGGRSRDGGPLQIFIETHDLKGSPPATLLSHEEAIQSFCWFVGDKVTYVGVNAGLTLWEIRVDPKTGKALSSPRRANQWLTADMCSISRSRDRKRMVFRRRTNRADVYVTELDSKGRLGTPRRLTLEDSNNIPWAWTPDSRAVIFTSDRSGSNRPYKQAIDQAVAEPIVTEDGNIYELRISPEGRSILYVTDRLGHRGQRLMRIPVAGGAPRLVLEASNGLEVSCPRAPGMSCLLPKDLGNAQTAIGLVDPERGEVRDLCKRSATTLDGWDISPDGSEIALLKSNFVTTEIELLSLSGQVKEKVRVQGWNRLNSVNYSADGKTFYAGLMGAGGATLLRIDRAGHATPLWRRLGTNISTWAIPSPNGRYLAFLANSSAENAWMIDGL